MDFVPTRGQCGGEVGKLSLGSSVPASGDAVENSHSARESWRAAFGLTVTIVWLYIELLRILAILRGND